MKVVHLTTVKSGGAYIAAKRIAEACTRKGIECELISLEDYQSNELSKFIYKVKYYLFHKMWLGFGGGETYITLDKCGKKLFKDPRIVEADVIHLHWISDGFINNRELEKLIKLEKKIIWTLHDMHPFTGGCHYDSNCGKYMSGCEDCPSVKSMFLKKLIRNNMKRKFYKGDNITIVGCSNWITNCAKNSIAMSQLKCVWIPNCINLDVYAPIQKRQARNELGLNVDPEKNVILFGAMGALTDKRKGFSYLKQALSNLDGKKYILFVFGGTVEENVNCEVVNLGYVNEPWKQVLVYSSADVFVAPSIQDNLPNTVLEAAACGTPSVAFNIGGMGDLIKKSSGILVEPFDTYAFAGAIEHCCKKENAEVLSIGARAHASDKFSYEDIASKYIELYKE